MNDTEKSRGSDIIPIWLWVGVILFFYGAIVASIGVYFIFNPQQETVLSNTNPNLWWGAVMIATGLLFFIPHARRLRRRG